LQVKLITPGLLACSVLPLWVNGVPASRQVAGGGGGGVKQHAAFVVGLQYLSKATIFWRRNCVWVYYYIDNLYCMEEWSALR
jgi:hypothetical protein